jgi:hypothetical protein
VEGVEASSVVTQVVDLVLLRDWLSMDEYPDDSVALDSPERFAITKPGIASFIDSTLPLPALPHESTGRRQVAQESF